MAIILGQRSRQRRGTGSHHPTIRQVLELATRKRRRQGTQAGLLPERLLSVSTRDPRPKAFYDRKRREGKHHTQAIIALARRRVTVLWTMLKTRQNFDPLKKAA